jgi:hypothetical protein
MNEITVQELNNIISTNNNLSVDNYDCIMIHNIISFLIYNKYNDWLVYDYDIINKNILIMYISKNNLLKKFLYKNENNYHNCIDSSGSNEHWICYNCDHVFNNKTICNNHIKNCLNI